eukprot:m.24371 g.24371  ORF g.24371 m.24371 type:complete len:230 (-) comp4155_c0_seq1:329-1018(-)
MIPWTAIGVSTACGLVVNMIVSNLCSHARYSNTPKFAINIGIAVQLGILPALTALAWGVGVQEHESTRAWLVSPWSERKIWEEALLVIAIASMAKDLPWLFKYRSEPPKMGDLMIAHHLGCIGIMVWCMATEPPGASLFVASTTGLEIGSALASLVEFNPTSSDMLWLFYWGMTVSNIQGIAAMVVYSAALPQCAWSTTMILVGVITMYFRQKTAIEYRDNFTRVGTAV